MTKNNILQGMPYKLKGGDWGVKLKQAIEPETVVDVEVSTKGGKKWRNQYRVIWTNSKNFSLAVEPRPDLRHHIRFCEHCGVLLPMYEFWYQSTTGTATCWDCCRTKGWKTNREYSDS